MQASARQQVVEWCAAIAVAAVLLPLCGLLVPAASAPLPGHGVEFAAMAADPFGFAGMFPHRVLWPALAHLAGCFGAGPVAFSHGCTAALLAVVFWICRRRGIGWIGALLVTVGVACSGAVLVHRTLACLSDPLNLLLLLLAFQFVHRPLVCWGLLLLGALSHELAFFFAPFWWWLRVRHGGRPGREAVLLLVTAGAYAGWRLLVGLLAPAGPGGAVAPKYDALYYVTANFWVPYGLPAVWALWWLVALAEFGPLLAAAVAGGRRRELGLGGPVGVGLYGAGVLLLMVLAYDVMRFATFLVLPVVLGGIALVRTTAGRVALGALIAATVLARRFTHPIPTEAGGRDFALASGHILDLLQHGHSLATPAAAWRFSAELLWRLPGAAAFAVAGTAVVAATGCWLARYVATASDGGSTPRTARNASP